MIKFHFNSPLILNFSFLSLLLLVLDQYLFRGLSATFFSASYHGMPGEWVHPIFYFKLVSHIFGHQNWNHLLSNFSLILLIGPVLEEKYGSSKLFTMVLFTALVTGILNTLLFKTSVMGASGIAFMLIILASITNQKSGKIPLTFILVFLIYAGREVSNIFQHNNISEFAHLIGALTGSAFGFIYGRK